MGDVEQPDPDVSEALARLLAWPDIARSAQLAGFLDYIVRKTLSGESANIKAYSIAVDVLGRSPDFDPQADPIVRVQARRLRSLLEQYYRTAGAGETLRIELPTGRYVPEFVRVEGRNALPPFVEAVDSKPVDGRIGGLPASWFLLALFTAALSMLAFGLSTWGQYNAGGGQTTGLMPAPTVMVMELQSLAGAVDAASTVAGLAVELVTDLEQFETMNVVYGGGGRSGDIAADYVLSGIVRREAGGLQYSAILTETASNSVIWNMAVAVAAADVDDPDLLNRVSGQLSRTLGSPRGPLHQRARAAIAEGKLLPGGENAYICRVLFDLYRERSTVAAGERAQACYAALSGVEPSSGQVLAAVASLVAEGLPEPGRPVLSADERLARAEELLMRAVEQAPVSGFVWEQRARFLELFGDDAGAEAAYSSALQLNPASSDALAARARHLALTGRLEAGRPLSESALDSALDPPDWYLGVPALLAYRAGDFALAVEQARVYAEADRELGPILVIMAGQGAGDRDIVASYLPRVLDVASFRANGILTQLRQRISDETLTRDIRQALLAAGLPPAVLNQGF